MKLRPHFIGWKKSCMVLLGTDWCRTFLFLNCLSEYPLFFVKPVNHIFESFLIFILIRVNKLSIRYFYRTVKICLIKFRFSSSILILLIFFCTKHWIIKYWLRLLKWSLLYFIFRLGGLFFFLISKKSEYLYQAVIPNSC